MVVFVLDDKGLQQLRRPGQEIAARQRAQRIGAHEGKHRLDDHAQHILIVVEIHPRLAAYGRIDLGEQGGRDIGIPHAALVDGRGETREVRRDPAADGEHQRLPGRPRLQQRTLDEQDRVHGLVLLGRLEGDAPPHAGHGLDHLGRHLRRVRVVNDEHFRLFRHQRGDLPQPFAADHPAGRLPIDSNDILLLHKNTKILEKFGNSPFLRYICNPSHLRPSPCPDGGIGRRAGLKIQCPLKTCGFEPRSGHAKRPLVAVFFGAQMGPSTPRRFAAAPEGATGGRPPDPLPSPFSRCGHLSAADVFITS